MTSGLTAAGFIAPTITEKVADLNTAFHGNIDATLDLDPDQPMGQVIGTYAADIVAVWEIIATLYNALNPNAAEGNLLVNACALSGTRPQVATYSIVDSAFLDLNAATTVPAGSRASVAGQPGNVWVLTADVVSTTAGAYPGTFRSNLPGPFVANAGTLNVINTPVVGWNAVGSESDAIQGVPADTDTTLRQKREAELAGQGSGDVDAIRAKLLEIPKMLNAFVFENTSLITDNTGLPGKAIRAVIWDGAAPAVADATIAATIWQQKPSGIQTFGAIANTILDSAGNPQPVNFDRAQQLRTYVTCTVTPLVGVVIGATERAAIRLAIKAYADATFGLGVSIIDLPFRASALLPPLTGDVPTFAFDFTATPTNTANKTVTGLQIATVSTADISVNGTFG